MPDERIAALAAGLRGKGERLTPARRQVLTTLAQSDHHLTAEEVLTEVQAQTANVHRATVYRTLETLSRLGIVEHTHLGHGPAVYHLADDAHHHLVCEACGRIVEVPVTLFRTVERRLRDEYDFVMRARHFAVVGRCRACA
ncbi:MAG: Fur family transcriptional regulator, ferric uptake regulator [Actinomycetota bacterium]|jgi:Fe2+ or Zn2+ uptake regulation protein|nr:Fur family transcriptional regulator, ferric uptake regulator [Actinomycetota bacterium]